MGNMKEIGLLDCEDRPSIEENFKRVQDAGGGDILDSNGKLKNEVLPEGYPYETVGLVEIIPKISVTTDSEGGAEIEEIPILQDIAFYEGKTVEVRLDNNRYECQLIRASKHALVCGNLSLLGGSGGEEYPFSFGFNLNDGSSMLIVANDDGGDHTFSLRGEGTVIVPMDKKFFPEGIGGGGLFVVEISANSESGGLKANVTNNEIYEAWQSGKLPICKYQNSVLQLSVINATTARFSSLGMNYDATEGTGVVAQVKTTNGLQTVDYASYNIWSEGGK